MEIDDLKQLWNKGDFPPKDELEIARMLKGTSRSIVDKIKRIVWIEMVLTFVVGLGMIVYTFTLPSGAEKWTLLALLFMFAGYYVYYIKKIRLLYTFNENAGNIRENLRGLVNRLDAYLKFYKRSYTVLYPAYFLLTLFFIGLEQGATEFLNNLQRPSIIIYLVVFCIVIYFFCTRLIDWILKKMYGNHLQKLEALLSDLEDPL